MTARSKGVAFAALAGMVAPVIAAAPASAAAPPTAHTSKPGMALPTAPKATYRVVPGDTLSTIAKKFGVDLADLVRTNRIANPHVIYPGQVLQIAAPASTAGKTPAAPKPSAPKPSTAATYTVKAGDTLSGIAAKHRTTVAALAKANAITNPNRIFPGQTLRLSAGASAPVNAAPAKPAPAKPAPAKAATYTVKAGDTLSAIAVRHQMSLGELTRVNNISSRTIIYPGQRLKVTTGGSQTVSPTPQQNLVPDTFLGYKYPDHVVAAANENKALLNSLPVPSRDEMRQIVRQTANQMGVDPSLALAVAMQESGFNQRAVSPANAIGTMQVIPSSGQWASDMVGRKLNLLDPHDNAVAGVAILRSLLRSADNLDQAIAGYYQGLGSVRANGMFSDTRNYVAGIKTLQQQFR